VQQPTIWAETHDDAVGGGDYLRLDNSALGDVHVAVGARFPEGFIERSIVG
jgi:hypothetical protein